MDNQPPYNQPANQPPYNQPGYQPYNQPANQSPYNQPGYQPNDQAPKLQYVGVGRRFVALFLDGIIIGIISGILAALIHKQDAASSSTITAIITLLYYVVLEGSMSATIGKRLMGIEVVNQNGLSISWSQSLIRNVLRIVDVIFVYLVGAIFVWTSPTKQRLGDRAAHTYVVKR